MALLCSVRDEPRSPCFTVETRMYAKYFLLMGKGVETPSLARMRQWWESQTVDCQAPAVRAHGSGAVRGGAGSLAPLRAHHASRPAYSGREMGRLDAD